MRRLSTLPFDAAEHPAHAVRRAASMPGRSLLLSIACGLFLLAACREPAPLRSPLPPATAAARPAAEAPMRTPVRIDPARPSQAARDFKAFALNILLVPLLDDDLPTRWADPSLSVPCDDAFVTIDGKRPDVGAPVPGEAFTLHWHMERCNPLDGYFELSGDVELRVEPQPDGYTASVRPIDLQVISLYGVDALDEGFTARMNVGR